MPKGGREAQKNKAAVPPRREKQACGEGESAALPKDVKIHPKASLGASAWGTGPSSEPVTLPFRQQRAEDQETPGDTENIQVTKAEGGSTTTTSYCPQNPLDIRPWVQIGMGVLGGSGAVFPQV